MAYSKQNFQNGQILNAANLEAMENGIIAGQGAENLLDNSNFRDPVNSRGKNTYSDAGNEYTIDRWETQGGTNISIENGYINIIGQWGLYQIIQNPKDGIYTFAARICINSIGQFTPIIEVNNGSNTGRQINLDADIGEWKTYILQYDLSSMTAETIKFLLSPRGGNTTASISVEWAAMYKGAYTANTLPAYVPKGKHVEMLNCGVSLQPHNLFDNSDFRNPVNSRSITSTEASGYHIDRWKKENSSGKVTVGNGYLSMTGTGAYWFLTQYIEPKKIKSGAVYTIALADTSGSVSVCSTVMSTDMAKFTARHTFTSGAVVITNVEYASDKYSIYFTSNSSKETRFAWAVLYEGFYTADTLPPYVPKGKHVEMLNCNVPLAPHNLLDNSDFRNPVNHQGASEYSGYLSYTIDRWFLPGSNVSVTVQSGSIKATATSDSTLASISQKIASATRYAGKTLTLAAYVQSNVTPRIIAYKGGTSIASKEGTSGSYQLLICNFTVPADITDGALSIRIQSKSTQAGDYVEAQWAALYEGAYTADTLPNYVPKDKHVEMLNCGVPLTPHNLLDNSDFRIKNNIINTKGLTDYSLDSGDVFDRWRLHWTGDGRVSIKDGYIELYRKTYSTYLFQHPKDLESMIGKTYTVAAKVRYNGYIGWIDSTQRVNSGSLALNDWDIATCTFTVGSATSDIGKAGIEIATKADLSFEVQWVALYEGAYTKETLPAYLTKGKHVEMLNCGVPLQPRNLLDNSDFRSPVNQRGIASGAVITGWDYFIDRWQARAENCSVNFSGEGITASTPIGQILPKETVKNGMTVTAAAKWSDGTICVASGAIRRTNEWGSFSSANINGHSLYVSDEGDGNHACITISEGTVVWAALYEGSYDASTLPPYQPKGYAAELAECMRYYQQYNIEEMSAVGSYENGNTYIRCQLSTPMRIAPSLVQSSVEMWTTYNSVDSVPQAFIFYKANPQTVSLKCANSHGSSSGQLVIATNNAAMAFSADL